MWRHYFIISVFGVLYAVLIFNLYSAQIEKSDYYFERAQSQLKAGGSFERIRGKIYFTDKNDNLIAGATNKEFDVVFAVPSEIQKNALSDENVKKLSVIADIPVEEIKKKLNKNNSYELLILKASPEQIKEINNLKIKGVGGKKSLLRFYPSENLASHILGFVSPTNDSEVLKYGNAQIGRYGMELQFNSILTGAEDIVLTIDENIQRQAEKELKKTVEKWGAEGGTVIIQEAGSGKILALANYPDFNPNNYSKYPIKNFLNPAAQSVYEFGSVVKVFTMAAGIDSGKLTPETFYIDTGSATLNGKTISNWWKKVYGKATMTEVIENSINTGSVFAEKTTGHKTFYDYLLAFGFNDSTGVNLPGEVRGDMKNLIKGRDINYATASFGQGVSFTAMELIGAFSALANGGVLMKPLILADEKPEAVRRTISEETAEKLTKMMESAVLKNKAAAINGYSVAGKTGTAYIPDFKYGGYTDEVINTFVGFLPAKGLPAGRQGEKKITFLFKLDKAKGAPFANETVAPAFRELAQFVINYYNIPPDAL